MSREKKSLNLDFLYKTMETRDPNKRKIKPIANADAIIMSEDSSDDSDYNPNPSNTSNSENEDNSSIERESLSNDSRVEVKSFTNSEPPEKSNINTTMNDNLICLICLNDNKLESETLVECDICGVVVHEECYGIFVGTPNAYTTKSKIDPMDIQSHSRRRGCKKDVVYRSSNKNKKLKTSFSYSDIPLDSPLINPSVDLVDIDQHIKNLNGVGTNTMVPGKGNTSQTSINLNELQGNARLLLSNNNTNKNSDDTTLINDKVKQQPNDDDDDENTIFLMDAVEDRQQTVEKNRKNPQSIDNPNNANDCDSVIENLNHLYCNSSFDSSYGSSRSHNTQHSIGSGGDNLYNVNEDLFLNEKNMINTANNGDDRDSVSSVFSTEPWFCEPCKAGVYLPTCQLCPAIPGIGAFKETDVRTWVHLVCALYTPSVTFADVQRLSTITLFELNYRKFGEKECAYCEDKLLARTGICIKCDAGMCRTYFHVTCAQREGLLIENYNIGLPMTFSNSPPQSARNKNVSSYNIPTGKNMNKNEPYSNTNDLENDFESEIYSQDFNTKGKGCGDAINNNHLSPENAYFAFCKLHYGLKEQYKKRARDYNLAVTRQLNKIRKLKRGDDYQGDDTFSMDLKDLYFKVDMSRNDITDFCKKYSNNNLFLHDNNLITDYIESKPMETLLDPEEFGNEHLNQKHQLLISKRILRRLCEKRSTYNAYEVDYGRSLLDYWLPDQSMEKIYGRHLTTDPYYVRCLIERKAPLFGIHRIESLLGFGTFINYTNPVTTNTTQHKDSNDIHESSMASDTSLLTLTPLNTPEFTPKFVDLFMERENALKKLTSNTVTIKSDINSLKFKHGELDKNVAKMRNLVENSTIEQNRHASHFEDIKKYMAILRLLSSKTEKDKIFQAQSSLDKQLDVSKMGPKSQRLKRALLNEKNKATISTTAATQERQRVAIQEFIKDSMNLLDSKVCKTTGKRFDDNALDITLCGENGTSSSSICVKQSPSFIHLLTQQTAKTINDNLLTQHNNNNNHTYYAKNDTSIITINGKILNPISLVTEKNHTQTSTQLTRNKDKYSTRGVVAKTEIPPNNKLIEQPIKNNVSIIQNIFKSVDSTKKPASSQLKKKSPTKIKRLKTENTVLDEENKGAFNSNTKSETLKSIDLKTEDIESDVTIGPQNMTVNADVSNPVKLEKNKIVEANKISLKKGTTPTITNKSKASLKQVNKCDIKPPVTESVETNISKTDSNLDDIIQNQSLIAFRKRFTKISMENKDSSLIYKKPSIKQKTDLKTLNTETQNNNEISATKTAKNGLEENGNINDKEVKVEFHEKSETIDIEAGRENIDNVNANSPHIEVNPNEIGKLKELNNITNDNINDETSTSIKKENVLTTKISLVTEIDCNISKKNISSPPIINAQIDKNMEKEICEIRHESDTITNLPQSSPDPVMTEKFPITINKISLTNTNHIVLDKTISDSFDNQELSHSAKQDIDLLDQSLDKVNLQKDSPKTTNDLRSYRLCTTSHKSKPTNINIISTTKSESDVCVNTVPNTTPLSPQKSIGHTEEISEKEIKQSKKPYSLRLKNYKNNSTFPYKHALNDITIMDNKCKGESSNTNKLNHDNKVQSVEPEYNHATYEIIRNTNPINIVPNGSLFAIEKISSINEDSPSCEFIK